MVISVPVTYPKQVIINYYQTVQSPLIIGLDSTTFTKSTKTYLDKVKPSGVILMGWNINNYSQTKELIKDIHDYAKNRGITVKVMTDEEGGLVSRFKNLQGYPDFQGMYNYNSTQARNQAVFLKNIGLDLNLAPVTDIAYKSDSIIALRSAGNTPEKVTQSTTDYIKILHEYGIESTIKHFPGHGRTSNDTHLQSATINISYSEWLKTDAKPIISAIANNTDFIMLGHLIYSKVDNSPASLSSTWVNIIRKELGYKGGIMTDDLKMAALNEDAYIKSCTIQDDKAHLIKKALDAGVNLPMLILSQADTTQVYSHWIEIEKVCN